MKHLFCCLNVQVEGNIYNIILPTILIFLLHRLTAAQHGMAQALRGHSLRDSYVWTVRIYTVTEYTISSPHSPIHNSVSF